MQTEDKQMYYSTKHIIKEERIEALPELAEKAIDECIEEFNFVQMAEIINFMHDKYTVNAPPEPEDESEIDGYVYVHRPPKKVTVNELMLKAYKLLRQVFIEKLQFIQSENFTVSKFAYTDDDGNETGYSLVLAFTPIDWTAEVELEDSNEDE